MGDSIYALRNIVVIGASAGGLQPLQQILGRLPQQLKNTAIVIAQHTSPNFESMLVNLLSKNTAIPISESRDGLQLEPNHIYTCPADTNVSIVAGKFKFTAPQPVGPKPSVDILFTSAAKSFDKDVIGIIVSGTGHDGAKGIVAIKNAGGFTIAQSPETTTYSGMPDSAILTEKVDMILSPEEIGDEIPKLLDNDYRQLKLEENTEAGEDLFENDAVSKVLELLQKKIGTDFSKYKKSTIHRRLDKRLKDKGLQTIESYIEEIENNPQELDNLFLYLLIGVTQFFRNPDSMIRLQEVLKVSLAQLSPDKNFRVWIPGCATGEEAYSIAILILDLIEKGATKPAHIQIFATDIDQLPLNKARQGKYPADSLKHVPQPFVKKYFHQQDNFYYINSEVKRHIIFSKHDITSNPPFLRLNLISCRNLLIYFKNPLQNQLIPLFHYTLEKDGILFLGSSENIGRFKNLFETLDHKHKIFRRHENEVPISHIPLLQPMARPEKPKIESYTSQKKSTLEERVKETLYVTYEHPYIIVDESLNIIEIYKEVSDFVRFQPGVAVLNALKLVDEKLRIDLRTLINNSMTTMTVVRGPLRNITINKENAAIRLKVQPIIDTGIGNRLFIISFEKAETNITLPEPGKGKSSDDPVILQLEHELLSTREHLNTLVEELETSNEELQSLNEELQSSNEELQASNEELETSNEELQATNEELNVAYSELRKITEKLESQSQKLKDSQSNLQSLLNNNQQAFILIDRNYVIISFNRYANTLFHELYGSNLEEGAVYIDFLPADNLAGFQKAFKNALQGKQVEGELAIKASKGKEYHVTYNYTPVENAKKAVDKVSLSFIDITEKKNYEIKMLKAFELVKQERELLTQIFEESPELIAIYSGPEYTITYANKNFRALFKDRSIMDKRLVDVIPEIKAQGFLEMLNRVRETNQSLQITEQPFYRNDGETGQQNLYYFNFVYTPISDPNRHEKSIVVIAVDITKEIIRRAQVEEEQQFLKMVSANISEHIMVVVPDQRIEFLNASALKFYGDDYPTTIPQLLQKTHKDEREALEQAIRTAFSDGSKLRQEARIQNAKGECCWHLFVGQSFLSKLIISATDINEQKVSQKNKDDFMGIASHELKTPLTTIKAYSQLLSEHLQYQQDDGLTKMYIQRNMESIAKLEKFVSDLLDITRIQSGRLALTVKPFALDIMARRVIQNLQLIHKDYSIHLNYGGKELIVNGDETRIEQVFINLINNAVKYSPEADTVVISLNRKMLVVEVSVQDFGIGIAEEDQENVFDRFYRVSETSKKVSGMGIGLNISKEIITLHGGKIWVESKPGVGSIFYFTIPLNDLQHEKNITV